MLSKLEVEDLSYLTATFLASKSGDESLHPTQRSAGRQINLKLLFAVPAFNDKEEKPWNASPGLDYIKEAPVKLVSIHVPRGIPIYKIRHLIKHVESELRDIYTDAKRLNIVLFKDDGSDVWEYAFELPTYGVAYV